MKPALGEVLQALSARLVGEVLAQLPPGYAQSDALVMSLITAGAAEEQERAAETRSADIREMREIFSRAAARVDEPSLSAALARAAGEEPVSLRIADLDRCVDAMRATLIDLHAFVEARTEVWAAAIDADIWCHLRATTARHAMATNPF